MQAAHVYNAVVKLDTRVFGRFAVVSPTRKQAHSVVQEWIARQELVSSSVTYSLIMAKMGSGHSIFIPDTLSESTEADFPGHSTKV